MWAAIRAKLFPGEVIPNWTAAHGYIGDTFKVVSITSSAIEISAPNAETIQRVYKKDVEFMLDNWKGYCAGKIKRSDIIKHTRVSKYSMSILKHVGVPGR
jgi:hypothetical protein